MASPNPRKDAFRIQGTGLLDCGALLTLVTIETIMSYEFAVGIYGVQVNSYKSKDAIPPIGGIPALPGGIVNLDFIAP